MVCLAASVPSYRSFARIGILLSFQLVFFASARVSLPAQAQVPPPQSAAVQKTPQDSILPPVEQILTSYEGQAVTSVEIAGHPDLKTSQFESKFAQRAGQPFAREKVNATAEALKSSGQFHNVRIQVEPEAKGLRVLFILEPAGA